MRFLMCAPDHFGVEYVINPWMQGNEGTVTTSTARDQWRNLHRLLTEPLGATVDVVPPQLGLPDMVFTANAGLVLGPICVPARFRPLERRGEEAHYRTWFAANGFKIADLPPDICYEGAGDALFDTSGVLWAAHGFRTDAVSHPYLAEIFATKVVSLRLIDPHYYHLDTCFCPLPGGYLLWYPPAFDAESQRTIQDRIPAERRYAVSDEDAARFACNAIAVGSNVVLNAASEPLIHWAVGQGFTVYQTPLDEFMRAGGSAKCLTLRLDD